MRVIQVDCAAHPIPLQIGLQGENGVTQVEFDTAGFYEEFGDGQAELIVRRCDNTSYPIDLDCYGNTWAWTISSTDTAFGGHGQAQLLYYVGETLKKSVVYKTYVSPSIAQGEAPPDPYESYLERMTAIGAQVAASVELAQAAVTQAQEILTEMQDLLENHNGITYEE